MKKSKLIGHQVICSAFIKKNDTFLLVMCPRFKVWRVPGGRAEHGEVLEETLLREMKEETGIELKNPRFIGFGQDQQFHVLGQRNTSRLIMYYLLETSQEPDMDPDECEEYRWVTLEDIKNIQNKEGALSDLFARNPDVSI